MENSVEGGEREQESSKGGVLLMNFATSSVWNLTSNACAFSRRMYHDFV